jgi:hypothetical protein
VNGQARFVVSDAERMLATGTETSELDTLAKAQPATGQ